MKKKWNEMEKKAKNNVIKDGLEPKEKNER